MVVEEDSVSPKRFEIALASRVISCAEYVSIAITVSATSKYEPKPPITVCVCVCVCLSSECMCVREREQFALQRHNVIKALQHRERNVPMILETPRSSNKDLTRQR